MSIQPKIEVFREYHTLRFINSCVMEVEIRLSVFIHKDAEYYILPLQEYLPKLRAKLHSSDLIVLPYHELSRGRAHQITIEEIRQMASEVVGGGAIERFQKINNFMLIKLPKRTEDYHDELILSWIERIPETISGKLDKVVSVYRLFLPTGSASRYVEIIIDDKFELKGDPDVFKVVEETVGYETLESFYSFIPLGQSEYDVILKDKRHHVLRFRREFPYDITLKYIIGVPSMVSNWLGLGTALGIGVIPITFILFLIDIESFKFTATWGGGTVALLVGFRILLFHDIELLRGWNRFYIALVIVDVVFLAVFAALRESIRLAFIH